MRKRTRSSSITGYGTSDRQSRSKRRGHRSSTRSLPNSKRKSSSPKKLVQTSKIDLVSKLALVTTPKRIQKDRSSVDSSDNSDNKKQGNDLANVSNKSRSRSFDPPLPGSASGDRILPPLFRAASDTRLFGQQAQRYHRKRERSKKPRKHRKPKTLNQKRWCTTYTFYYPDERNKSRHYANPTVFKGDQRNVDNYESSGDSSSFSVNSPRANSKKPKFKKNKKTKRSRSKEKRKRRPIPPGSSGGYYYVDGSASKDTNYYYYQNGSKYLATSFNLKAKHSKNSKQKGEGDHSGDEENIYIIPDLSAGQSWTSSVSQFQTESEVGASAATKPNLVTNNINIIAKHSSSTKIHVNGLNSVENLQAKNTCTSAAFASHNNNRKPVLSVLNQPDNNNNCSRSSNDLISSASKVTTRRRSDGAQTVDTGAIVGNINKKKNIISKISPNNAPPNFDNKYNMIEELRIKETLQVDSNKAPLINDENCENEGVVTKSGWIMPVKDARAICDRFVFHEKIGSGNFAIVYRAHNKKTNAWMAIKEIDKTKLKGKRQHVENEVELLARCRHPNIIHLISAYQDDNTYYIALELLENGDLFDAIKANGNFDETMARSTVYDVARALAYLHENHVVHRDIKPENLLLTNGFQVKLADFGLACKVLGPLYRVCGTPTYVAPEILAQTGYETEVDVWSLGIITYIMICGYAPFQHKDRTKLFKKIQKGHLTFDTKHWDLVSEEAIRFIRNMLTVDRTERLSALGILENEWVCRRKGRKY